LAPESEALLLAEPVSELEDVSVLVEADFPEELELL
jgi:hypothetical protein